jgi:tetratricopeptide (TPR) repeat protein
MTAFTIRRPSRRPLVVVIGVLAVAIATQVASVWTGDRAGLDEPLLAAPPAAEIDAAAGPAAGADAVSVLAPAGAVPEDGANAAAIDPAPVVRAPVAPRPVAPATGGRRNFDPTAELTRIRADVDFWAARLTAHPNDIVSAVKLAESDVAEARMTGDVTAYLRAEQAADAAIVAQPGYLPAQSMRASILVSLHRFPEARELARWILFRSPADSTALGVLGDASLELGDLTTAATAYSRLALVADGSAAQVRAARLAFVEGDPGAAVAGDRTAAASATLEGLEGDALGFYHVTLGETLIAAGDPAGARSAFEAALAVRPDLPAALVGLAKLDAFDGDLSTAIEELDTAIAAIPLPDTLARRADLLTLRGEPGDAQQAQADMATVEAIAQLAGEAGSVYDRGLSLYLSDHGLEPDRAVRLARDELAVRPDVYGYDTLAWALLNAGDAATADAPMRSALAAGTKDARLWYHAGLISLANGRPDEAETDLRAALALGPALDPMSRARATDALATVR